MLPVATKLTVALMTLFCRVVELCPEYLESCRKLTAGADEVRQRLAETGGVNHWIESSVEALKDHLFLPLPVSFHDKMVRIVLAALTDRWKAVKAVHRPTHPDQHVVVVSPTWYHKLHVNYSLVQLAVTPRAKSLDVSDIFPRNLRSEILANIGKMSGLERLNLSSRAGGLGGGGGGGGGAFKSSVGTAWLSTWKSMQTLTKLRHFILRQDCQNDCLAVLAQNCPDLVYIDVSGSQK